MGRSHTLRVYRLQLVAHFGLAFATAPRLRRLTLLQTSNSPDHYAKGTPSAACRASSALGLRPLVGTWFQVLLAPHLGSFSPFTHGTGSLSVTREYLAFEGGPPRFLRGCTCPVVLGYAHQRDQCDFVYRAITCCGGSFQSLRLPSRLVTLRGSPTSAPQPRTGFRQSGLGSSRFARRYSGNRVFFLFLEVLRCFSSLGSRLATYGFSDGRLGITPAGFPHSGILGSTPACDSPRLIAASHALHRFLAPRHPPFALSSLTTKVVACLRRTSLGYTRESSYSIVKEPRGRSRDTRHIA